MGQKLKVQNNIIEQNTLNCIYIWTPERERKIEHLKKQ